MKMFPDIQTHDTIAMSQTWRQFKTASVQCLIQTIKNTMVDELPFSVHPHYRQWIQYIYQTHPCLTPKGINEDVLTFHLCDEFQSDVF